MKKSFHVCLFVFFILGFSALYLGAEPVFESDIKGKIIEEDNAYFFVGEKYDKKFRLPEDVDPVIEKYLDLSMDIIAGGFDMEQDQIWILKFYIPSTHEKIQIFPGRPGGSGTKEVMDITDDLEKYGYLFVNKLELDIGKMYLFNFAKALKIELEPENAMYSGDRDEKKILTQGLSSDQITSQDEATAENISSLVLLLAGIGIEQADKRIQIQNRIVSLVLADLRNRGFTSVSTDDIEILDSQNIRVTDSQGETKNSIIVKIGFNESVLYVAADVDPETQNVKAPEIIDAGSSLVGTLMARNALAKTLSIKDKEDITFLDTLATTDYIQEKVLHKETHEDISRIKTQEIAFRVGEETYLVAATYIEVSSHALPSLNSYADKEPQGQILQTSSLKNAATSEGGPTIIARIPEDADTSAPISYWGLFKLILPNQPDKRVALLEQVEHRKTEPTLAGGDSKMEFKDDKISRLEDLAKRIENLGLAEYADALKEKEESKQSHGKDEEALKQSGIGIDRRPDTESSSPAAPNPK